MPPDRESRTLSAPRIPTEAFWPPRYSLEPKAAARSSGCPEVANIALLRTLGHPFKAPARPLPGAYSASPMAACSASVSMEAHPATGRSIAWSQAPPNRWSFTISPESRRTPVIPSPSRCSPATVASTAWVWPACFPSTPMAATTASATCSAHPAPRPAICTELPMRSWKERTADCTE